MTVEFMKVPEGKQEQWLTLEREWKPMHELRVKDGSIQSWAAIAQTVPGDESNGPVYATVTTYRGWPDPTKMNFEVLAKKAHPQGDVNALMQQTQAARSMVRTEIWQVLEQTDPRLAQVVQMRYFGGYSEAEIAGTLQVTERTVERLWVKAKLMLLAAID